MKRRNNNKKFVYISVIIIVVLLIVIKNIFVGKPQKIYKEYVKKYEAAVEKYLNENSSLIGESTTYTYDDMTKILVDNGYIEEFSDQSVEVGSEPILVSKNSGNISFHNYYNEQTLENGFEMTFKKGDKTYTCTKNNCK